MWTECIPQCGNRTDIVLARAFTNWAVAQPDNVRMALRASYVRTLYQEVRTADWPPYKDFARELKHLMPRRRYWLGQYGKKGPTVYAVPAEQPVAVVKLAAKRKRA